MQPPPAPSSIASLAYAAVATTGTDEVMQDDADPMEGTSSSARLAPRDNTVSAHAHQFKKVLELSDVIIQVRRSFRFVPYIDEGVES